MSLGYWATHEYERARVDRLEGFMSWAKLLEVVEAAGSMRNKAFVATLFETGGRVSEVLALESDCFEIRLDEGLILVRGMTKLKKYEKIAEYLDEDGGTRWITKPVEDYRQTFPILIAEPLAGLVGSWAKNSVGLLFPSPYRPGPLSRSWAYKLLRRIGDEVNMDLWPHRLRAERASQLVEDYGYTTLDLRSYFGWAKLDQAAHYASRGWRGLAAKMRPVKYI